MYMYTFLLRMADTMTSQNIDISSLEILYKEEATVFFFCPWKRTNALKMLRNWKLDLQKCRAPAIELLPNTAWPSCNFLEIGLGIGHRCWRILSLHHGLHNCYTSIPTFLSSLYRKCFSRWLMPPEHKFCSFPSSYSYQELLALPHFPPPPQNITRRNDYAKR
jgi:hypothetical protein